MPLSRRSALKGLAAASAVSALNPGSLLATSDQPKSAPASDALRQSVCKCASQNPAARAGAPGRSIGLESIELLGPDEWPIVQAEGLTCAIANGTTQIPNGFNRVENHASMVPSMIERIAQCAAAGIEKVIVFSGNRAGMPDEQGLENAPWA